MGGGRHPPGKSWVGGGGTKGQQGREASHPAGEGQWALPAPAQRSILSLLLLELQVEGDNQEQANFQ